ncbi:Uncharacterised protein [Mycobacterium tuberculosis]|uniref:Uncharacterized protein n=1 Tax=Mycobacterium tuberculosis TaxID=1773 RepID=A0A655JSR6_MYCTX|nr:Uncharacterised protein [Mycobacterium tuberculosis]COY49431.1 Uncharacterised protein [Mycobacterium tuberculosis]
MPSPSALAVDTGAQKCEREPGSLNAKVPSCFPEAMSANRSGRPGGGDAATVTAAAMCIK